MIANPKEIPVEIEDGGDVREKTVSIQRDPTCPELPFVLMLEVPGSDVAFVARSRSAKALARWAFDRGALAVRHDYDLRLDP